MRFWHVKHKVSAPGLLRSPQVLWIWRVSRRWFRNPWFVKRNEWSATVSISSPPSSEKACAPVRTARSQRSVSIDSRVRECR